jgi:hypothetical protein
MLSLNHGNKEKSFAQIKSFHLIVIIFAIFIGDTSLLTVDDPTGVALIKKEQHAKHSPNLVGTLSRSLKEEVFYKGI